MARTHQLLMIAASTLLGARALGQEATPSRPAAAERPAQPAATPSPSGDEPAENEITPELDAAVSSGLAALARTQKEDGSFGDIQLGRTVAITSIACLAFMADGNAPDRGPYSEQVRKGLDYVLKNCTESGLIAAPQANTPMYGHGFATLFLGEVYGMTGGEGTDLDARVYEALKKAVRLIESTQNDEGGWRYNPFPFDADVSVTICQVKALRSARNAGLEVNKDVIDKAVEYVRACQNPDGGFRYQSMMGASAWPRTAAGVSTLYYAGIYQDRAIEAGLKYLRNYAMPGKEVPQPPHYFYGHYYSVQAMFLAGGDRWKEWWPKIRQELLGQQRKEDKLWTDSTHGDEYATGMALIILQIPKRYLPIFQR